MRKIVLGLAAMALIFTSCSKDETTAVNSSNPDAIGFEMSTGIARATSNNLVSLQGDAAGFGVYAVGSTTPALIANQGYKWNTTDTKWEWDGTPNMWPAATSGEYPISFYAYYPKAGVTLAAGALTNAYTVAATAAAQVDYLAANQLAVASRPSSSNVALAFKHILSKIDFKVAVGADMTVKVQSIAIKNVGNAGTFNFATLAWSAAPTTFTSGYDYLSTAKPAQSYTTTAGTAVTGTSGSLMLMPQNISTRTAWDPTASGAVAPVAQAYIEVVYRVVGTSSGDDVVGYTEAQDHPNYSTGSPYLPVPAADSPLFVKVGYPLPTNWLMSSAYTYTIYLGDPDASGGNLIDDTFIDEDGDETGLPVVDPTDPTVPKVIPDPIFDLTKPIGFTVSVDAWTIVSDIDLK